jgi:molybdenum cofactor guanylyltransferase
MGQRKADLPWGSETLLQHTAHVLSQVATPVVVVAAAEQDLPTLPPECIVVRDAEPDAGPVVAIQLGLHTINALASRWPRLQQAMICAVDLPFLNVAALQRLLSISDRTLPTQAGGIAWHDGTRWHPFPSVLHLDRLTQRLTTLTEPIRSLQQLFQALNLERLTPAEQQQIDPTEQLWAGCNTPDEYQAAQQRRRLNPTADHTPPS